MACDQHDIEQELLARPVEPFSARIAVRTSPDEDTPAEAREARAEMADQLLRHFSLALEHEELETEGVGSNWVENAQRARPYLIYALCVLRRLEEG